MGNSIWGQRPMFRSKRGNRCMLMGGHVSMLVCSNCGISHPHTQKFYNGGKCKRCGREWKFRVV
jgi:hypothetical protein